MSIGWTLGDLHRLKTTATWSLIRMDWQYRHSLLGLLALANFTAVVARLVISPLVPDIMAAFTVSKGLVGLVLTGMWAVYAVMQFPSGVLAERYGERLIILTAIGLTTLGSLSIALSPSFLWFGLFVLFLGAGAGLYFTVGAALLTKRFHNTGLALGLHTAGGPIAGLSAPIFGAFVGTRYGWRAGILVGAVIAIPVLVLLAIRIRPTPPVDPTRSLRDRLDFTALSTLIADRKIKFTILIAGISSFSWQSFSSFFPTFLIENYGFATGTASVIFGSVFILSAIGLPIVGRLSDRFGRDGVLALVALSFAVGMGVLLTGATPVRLALGVFGLGLGTSWAGALHSRFMDNFPTDQQGSGFGLVRTLYMLFAASGSVVTGVLAEVGGWVMAYGLLSGLLTVVALLLIVNFVFDLEL